MFWTQNGDGVDNTLVFWALLSHAYPKARTFVYVCVSHIFPVAGGGTLNIKKSGREHR